jgi:hypothetical protein
MSYDLYARHSRFHPVPPAPPLPRDVWVGRVFVEADGTTLESVWDGRETYQAQPWPEGPARSLRRLARRHVRS